MEISSMDRHDCDNEEGDSDFVNCSTPCRGPNLINHALERANANSLTSQAVEIDSKTMRNENQMTSGDLEPREIVSNNSTEVPEKQDRQGIVMRLASFDTTSIVEYVREVGQSPKEGADDLELEVAKAQLLAFSCWRGYSQLPDFSVLSGTIRCDTDAVVLECSNELIDDAPPGFECYQAMWDLIGSLNNSQVSNVRVDEHIASKAACFCSTRLVEYLKGLGGSPCGEVDELELAVAKTQLLAFTNWKGYSQLPELTLLNGSLASDTNLRILGYENCSALIADASVGFRGNKIESTHTVSRDLDGQIDPRKRPYKTVGDPFISPIACFEPTKLVSYLKVLGVSPYVGLRDSKLKCEEAKAQLFAFSCWKGFSDLPQFTMLGGHISREQNLSDESIEYAIPCNSNCGNRNVKTVLHTLQGQMDVWEKSNDRLDGEVVCRAACFDTMLNDPSGDNADQELMGQEYCCSDLVDDAPPGFEHYRMISHGQIDLNEELNRINEEEVDRTAPCLDNMELGGYLRTLSKSSLEQVCESELKEAKSQLQGSSWKGCSQPPEFTNFGSSENVTEMEFPEDETCSQLMGATHPLFGDKDGINGVRSSSQDQSANLRKMRQNSDETITRLFGDKDGIDDMRSSSQDQSTNLRKMKQISDETINPQKRKKSSPVLSEENRLQKLEEDIVCNTPCSDRMNLIGVSRTSSESPLEQLGGSEFIEANKVVGKLDDVALDPLDECHYEFSGKKRIAEASCDAHRSSKSSRTMIREYTCSELLLELLFTATNPLERLDLSIPILSFFSQFKDSVASGSSSLLEPIECQEHVSISETPSSLKSFGNTEPTGLSYPKDSCFSDHLAEKVSERQFNRSNQDAWNILLKVSREEASPSSEQQILIATVVSEPDNLPEKSGAEVGETTNNVGKDIGEADYQTALVLTFNNMAAVPSEGYLNKVFSCFGQLNERETKIFNKRNGCRVVYRRHADAEAAFTSVGKHGIFRDTLLSYRLKYIHSKPARAPTRTRRRNNGSASYTFVGIPSPTTLVGL